MGLPVEPSRTLHERALGTRLYYNLYLFLIFTFAEMRTYSNLNYYIYFFLYLFLYIVFISKYKFRGETPKLGMLREQI